MMLENNEREFTIFDLQRMAAGKPMTESAGEREVEITEADLDRLAAQAFDRPVRKAQASREEVTETADLDRLSAGLFGREIKETR